MFWDETKQISSAHSNFHRISLFLLTDLKGSASHSSTELDIFQGRHFPFCFFHFAHDISAIAVLSESKEQEVTHL
jgi:hypothetical protein